MPEQENDHVSLSEAQELNEYLNKFHHPIGDNRNWDVKTRLEQVCGILIALDERLTELEERFGGKTNSSS